MNYIFPIKERGKCMVTYLRSKGKRVTTGGRGDLFWSKSLGLGRYTRWQESSGYCKTHERGDVRRLERNQNKPSVLQFAYKGLEWKPLFAIQLSFQSPLACWLQNVDADFRDGTVFYLQPILNDQVATGWRGHMGWCVCKCSENITQ